MTSEQVPEQRRCPCGEEFVEHAGQKYGDRCLRRVNAAYRPTTMSPFMRLTQERRQPAKELGR